MEGRHLAEGRTAPEAELEPQQDKEGEGGLEL